MVAQSPRVLRAAIVSETNAPIDGSAGTIAKTEARSKALGTPATLRSGPTTRRRQTALPSEAPQIPSGTAK